MRSEHDRGAELERVTAALHRAERENERLRADMDSLEDLLAMAAHETLKPLVLAEARAAEVLERSRLRLDVMAKQDLDAMIRASARTRLEVEALLVHLRNSRTEPRRQYVDMTEVVQCALDLLAPEIRARQARVTVDPLPVVPGDPALLGGAVSNLVANALKYGARSQSAIRIGCERSGGGWMFEVDSPGRPIPERDRRKIFEPWERGRVERRAKGAGLGLTIVRRIVELHGGQVGVQPLGSSGNRFYFTLPAS